MKDTLLKGGFHCHIFKKALAAGIPFALGATLLTAIGSSGKLILSEFVDLEDLAIYGVGTSLAFVIMAVVRGISKAVQPRILQECRSGHRDWSEIYLMMSVRCNAMVTCISIPYMMLVYFFVGKFLNNSYASALEVFSYTSIVPILYMHYLLFSTFLIADGKRGYYFYSMFAAFGCCTATTYLMAPVFGIGAGVLGILFGYGAMLFVTYYFFSKSVASLGSKSSALSNGFVIVIGAICINFEKYFEAWELAIVFIVLFISALSVSARALGVTTFSKLREFTCDPVKFFGL